MNKSKRYAIWIGGGIVLLFSMVLVIAYTLIALNKDRLTTLTIAQIKKQVNGDVRIGDLQPHFLRTFPNISVRLSDVTIRDSIWNVHHHDFFKADKIYIRLQFSSLLTGKPKIGKVIIDQATINLYTDECGYCNLNRSEDISFSKGKAEIPEFAFYNTRLIIENQFLNSFHDFEAKSIDCTIKPTDDVLDMKFKMNVLVHSLGFNMAKGSYLKEKRLKGDFHVFYYPKDKIEFRDIVWDIDRQPFTINGAIFLHTEPRSFDLTFSTENVNYKKASGLLTEALRQKIDSFDIVQPFNASVELNGVMMYRAKPYVNVQFSVDEVDMTTPMGDFSHCSFSGSFLNQVDSLELPGDLNSKFTFNNIFAEWSGIPLTSSTVEIENLLTPFLKCHLQSLFELKALNDLTESSTINFIKGSGLLDVDFDGAIGTIDTVYPTVTGSFSLSDADFKYTPRDLLFQNCNGSLEFKDENVVINNLSATAGNTQLTMSGKVSNLLALLNDELAQPLIEWNIATPELNLNDFITYIKPRAQIEIAKKTKTNKMIKAAENIDRFLQDGTARINMKADEMMYKNFVAKHVAGSIVLIENKVVFDDVALEHAGGKVKLKGSLINGNGSNQLALNSTIDHVNIPELFKSFDNFGQDAITYKNIKGQMSANINMTGIITDKATVAENSMKGTVDFSITNGELINFEPAMNIAATAFKKRDFSHIQFGELKNKLSINGSAFGIEKMEIRSNVVVLFAEGTYDTKKGTDMSLQVPLSNLSKAENELINTGKVGVSVRLRAKTGEDGKLGITWDPFNNASRERKAEAKQDSVKNEGEPKEKSGKIK